MKDRIEQEAFEMQQRVERGEQPIVGVNCFVDEGERVEPELQRIDPAGERRQVDRLHAWREARDAGAVECALGRLRAAARDDEARLCEPLREALAAGANRRRDVRDAARRLGHVRRGARRAYLERQLSARRSSSRSSRIRRYEPSRSGSISGEASDGAAVLALVVQAGAASGSRRRAPRSRGTPPAARSARRRRCRSCGCPAVSISSPPPAGRSGGRPWSSAGHAR